MSTSVASARITVVTGPERGQSAELVGEILHIGQTGECGLLINDPLFENRLASVCVRNNRHAIYVTGTDEVEVDGTRIPPDRWVWLPRNCAILLTRRTTLEFQSLLSADDVDYELTPNAGVPVSAPERRTGPGGPPRPAPAKSNVPPSTEMTGRKAGRKADGKGDKTKPKVARFVTDQAGDPLVRLGEDGHLPELQLQEGQSATPTKNPTEQSQSASTGLIIAFCCSVGLSLGMLFVDFNGLGGSYSQTTVAHQVLPIFYGEDGGSLEPYQVLLRRASQAHSKGDYGTERQLYREVLRMLRAENRNSLIGVTRLSPAAQNKFEALTINQLSQLNGPTDHFLDLKNDERLERVLSILLRN